MTNNWSKSKITNAVAECDRFIVQAKLDRLYNFFYYTIFTKSLDEGNKLVGDLSKQLKLIDSNNGDTFEVVGQSFLPKKIRFLRIRMPDDTETEIAADVLGENIDNVIAQLKDLSISFEIINRPDNKMLRILSANKRVAIYFPEKHFLNDLA